MGNLASLVEKVGHKVCISTKIVCRHTTVYIFCISNLIRVLFHGCSQLVIQADHTANVKSGLLSLPCTRGVDHA